MSTSEDTLTYLCVIHTTHVLAECKVCFEDYTKSLATSYFDFRGCQTRRKLAAQIDNLAPDDIPESSI